MSRKLENMEGQVFPTYQGGDCTIIEYIDSKKVRVQFNDRHGAKVWAQLPRIRSGKVKNPYAPTVHGVGFFGEGPHPSKIDKVTQKPYQVWRGMLERCYTAAAQEKFPTYIGCTVSEEWLNFQVFAQWFNDQDKPADWELDKDILFRGNKLYSAETCALVPLHVNSLLILKPRHRGAHPIGTYQAGERFYAQMTTPENAHVHLGSYATSEEAFHAYKVAKEAFIQKTALQWQQLLDPAVFTALMNYRVNIND